MGFEPDHIRVKSTLRTTCTVSEQTIVLSAGKIKIPIGTGKGRKTPSSQPNVKRCERSRLKSTKAQSALMNVLYLFLTYSILLPYLPLYILSIPLYLYCIRLSLSFSTYLANERAVPLRTSGANPRRGISSYSVCTIPFPSAFVQGTLTAHLFAYKYHNSFRSPQLPPVRVGTTPAKDS